MRARSPDVDLMLGPFGLTKAYVIILIMGGCPLDYNVADAVMLKGVCLLLSCQCCFLLFIL